MDNSKGDKKEFTPLGEAIREMLKQYKIQDKFDEQSLIDNWPLIVGKSAAEKTRRIFIRNHVLFAEMTSPSLKHELSLNKEAVINRINSDYPSAQIKEIVIL
jgi:predicted nucleic acid-binding Zn ribbon protein